MRTASGLIANVITDWILSLGGWFALVVVFLVPALEASAFLGFLFPGEIAVILGGVLAANGRVPLAAVIVAAVAGAIIGDTVGYFVGRRWGHQILRGVGKRIPFLGHRIDDHLASARAFLQRRGGSAVFFGRFTAALRVMVPGLAGMAELPYLQFAMFNILGGVIWATGFVLLGYFAGTAWERVARDATDIGLGLLVLVLLLLIGGRVLRNVREHDQPLPDRLAALRPVAWCRSTYPRTSGWLASRVDTTSPRGFLLSVAVVAGAASAWLFGAVAQDVVANDDAALSDARVLQSIVDTRVAWLTVGMKITSWLGSNAVLIPVVVALGVLLLVRRKTYRPLALLALALAGADASYELAKHLVDRPRPPVALHLVAVRSSSFPSSHATAAFAVWGVIALVLAREWRGVGRWALWVVAVLIASTVAFSRLYLGVHWPTDVVAGAALGAAWFCALAAWALWSSGPRDGGRRSSVTAR